MNEEAIIKMGLDSSQVSQGLNELTPKLEDFGKRGKASWLHVGSGAREFHTLVHRLAEQSPILGTALRLIISPITAAIGGALLLLESFNAKIKEVAQGLNRMEVFGEKPLVNFRENLRQSRKDLAELQQEFSKWLRTHEQSQGTNIVQHLGTSMELLRERAKEASAGASPEQKAQLEKARLQLEFKMQAQALLAISSERMKAAQDVEMWQRVSETKAKDPRGKNAADLAAATKEQIAEIETQIREHRELLNKGPGLADMALWATGNGPTYKDFFTEQQRQIDSLQDRKKEAEKQLAQQNRVIDQETAQHKAVADRLAESKGHYDKLVGQFDALSAAVEKTRVDMLSQPAPGKPNSNPAQAGMDAYNKMIAEKNAAYAKQIQDELDKFYHRTPKKMGLDNLDQQGPVTVEGVLKAIKDELVILNKMAGGGGIAVYGTDK